MSPDPPEFAVLGAPKAGTTALCHYLSGHPGILVSAPKETRHFSCHFEQGPQEYGSRCFPGWTGQLRGDGTPDSLYVPYVAGRIRQQAPAARLVALLRDPVERAFSHWWMQSSLGYEPLPFEEALRRNLEQEPLERLLAGPDGPGAWVRARAEMLAGRPRLRTYLEVGHYGLHLERYLALFPGEQLLVVFSHDLKARPEEETRRVVAFLGLDPGDLAGSFALHWQALGPAAAGLRRRLARGGLAQAGYGPAFASLAGALRRLGDRPPRIPESARRTLREHFRPHDDRLRDLLGRRLPWG